MLGNFSRLFCCLLSFFIIIFSEKFFQEHDQSVKQFGSRSGPTFCRPDLGPNCLQRSSTVDKIRREQAKELRDVTML